jgi:hypothetical protein
MRCTCQIWRRTHKNSLENPAILTDVAETAHY